MTRRRDPDDYCPICGRYMHEDHRCAPSALRAIDAGDRGASPEPGNEPLADEARRSEAERLCEGLAQWENAIQ